MYIYALTDPHFYTCYVPQMSGSIIDCQDFIQLQEQAFVRLKLQHALDVKVQLTRMGVHLPL